MVFLELFLRGAGAMVAILWAILLLRDARDNLAARLGVIFLAASVCAAIIHTAQGLAPPIGVRAILLPVSSSWIVFLWLAARSFFDDDFRLTLIDITVATVWLLFGVFIYTDLVAGQPLSLRWAATIRDILSYVLVGHILYVVISGVGSDLVEARRKSRMAFALSLLSIYILNKAGETFFSYRELPLWFTALLYGLIAIVLMAGLLGFVTIDRKANGLLADGAAQKTPAPPEISGADRKLIEHLAHIIETDRAYLEPDLSILDLANRVGVGEHQLRALINKTMGFRNFRGFLNHYRVKEAVSAISDPVNEDVPILKLAMDAGFGSLASFNRAFKQETGMSPSDMRGGKKTAEITT